MSDLESHHQYTVMNCIKTILQSRLVRVVICVIILTFGVILPMLSYNMEHSMYSKLWKHQRNPAKQKSENERRLLRAYETIDRVNSSITQKMKVDHMNENLVIKSSLDISITVVTTRRHSIKRYLPHYLVPVVAEFYKIIQEQGTERKRYKLFLCNVDETPSKHQDALSLADRLNLMTFTRYNITNRDKKVNIFEKEKQDYVYCLNETLNQQAKYALIIEDDALPRPEILDILNHVLDFRLQFRNRIDSMSYMKLFHPPSLLTYYSFEVNRIPELLSLSCFLSTVLVTLYRLTAANKTRSEIHMVWFMFYLYVMVIAVMVGRQHLMQIRRISRHLYSVLPAPSCCTPAMLFSRNGGRKLVQFLSNITCKARYGKDIALDDFRKQTSLKAYYIEPNLVEHIGLVSAVRKRDEDPYI